MRLTVYFKDKTIGVRTYEGITDLEKMKQTLEFTCNDWRVVIPWENVNAVEYQLKEDAGMTGPVDDNRVGMM